MSIWIQVVLLHIICCICLVSSNCPSNHFRVTRVDAVQSCGTQQDQTCVVTMSSYHHWSGHAASKGVDGDVDTYAHTQAGVNPTAANPHWFRVDLGSTRLISRVEYWNTYLTDVVWGSQIRLGDSAVWDGNAVLGLSSNRPGSANMTKG